MTEIRTLREVWQDGPPIRLTTLARLAGYSKHKLLQEVRDRRLRTLRDHDRVKSPHLVERAEAQRWLQSLGPR